ncbi:GNAT family N-acetyltransferase [Paenibacillus sp. NPDC057934]|uniref:GNAT family N-acetyltransferase n=1 Tax=Paenibacillus sp. NPDC057934 TaxID=3346282 RepID=UPI0036DCAB34
MWPTHLDELSGEAIRLVPMEKSHTAGLTAVLASPSIWEYTWRQVTTPEQIDQLLLTALANKENGTEAPYTIFDRATDQIIGTTRIHHLDVNHRNAEIGCTWIAPDYWRTRVNTESKSLLLHYCFEELELVRVQFSVIGNNQRSQRAVERIGGVREGVLRNHRLRSNGTVLDNVIYSILDSEWPTVKDNLHYLLNHKY